MTAQVRLTREIRLPVLQFQELGWFWDMRLRVTVQGKTDPQSGYLCDAQELERWVLERLARSPDAMVESPGREALCFLWNHLRDACLARGRLAELELAFPNGWRWGMKAENPNLVLLTGQFHFCAAHRLHNPALSDEENRQLFGICNNPAGHGHNYVLDVTIAQHQEQSPDRMSAEELQRLVVERVLRHLDHRHLNLDVPEFANRNPTTEAVASVIWNLLEPTLPEWMLWGVRVAETAKIWAEVRREDNQLCEVDP